MFEKVVWILGSGFSKSLGGPLLADLLSDRSGGEAQARLKASKRFEHIVGELFEQRPSRPEPPDYRLVYGVFAEHLRGSDASKGRPVHWDHAEEFLTFVDSTAQDYVRREILKQWLPGDWRSDDQVTKFRNFAVQAIASECHFLQSASVDQDEAWRPYFRWGTGLDSINSAIVTFNYDLALETLGTAKEMWRIKRGGVIVPGKDFGEVGCVDIYKLHGSVDWFIDEHGNFSRQDDFVQATDRGLRPLIGTPGLAKRTLRSGRLKQIWDLAETKLRQADVIVFLGYRSPPSDPDARAFILEAISAKDGKDVPKHRRVHLVLGPNTADPAVARLDKLVQFSMEASGRMRRDILGHSSEQARYEVIKQPLYVEDFLSVYHDAELYGPDHT